MKMEKVMAKQEPNTTKEQEFTTTPSRTVTDIEQQQGGDMAEGNKIVPKTVTPPEAPPVKEELVDDENNEKQVRFGDDQIKKDDPESNTEKDENATRRNRSVKAESSRGAVLEFKTYRSPSRKRDEEVPSLCSTGSDAPAEKASKSAKPASSISVDPSKDTTSPLASHDAEKSEKEVTRKTADIEVSVF